jgi:hypothetical protein
MEWLHLLTLIWHSLVWILGPQVANLNDVLHALLLSFKVNNGVERKNKRQSLTSTFFPIHHSHSPHIYYVINQRSGMVIWLFNDAFNCIGHTAWDVGMTARHTFKELVRKLKSWPILVHYPSICLEGLKKSKNSMLHYSRFPFEIQTWHMYTWKECC